MKAAVVRGVKDIRVEEVPVPEISDDEVLLEVKYCGICGSDLISFLRAEHYKPGTYIGHEYAGVLTKVGKNVKDMQVGDRVTVMPGYVCGECWACAHGEPQQCVHFVDMGTGVTTGLEFAGAYAKYIRVPIPEKRVYQLPDNVSFEVGAMTEPLASSFHAVRVSDLKPGEDTMVIGAGPVGLGVIAFLKYAGAGQIIVTEPVARRAQLAKKFGADYVFDPHKEPDLQKKVMELTRGKGIDRLYQCSQNIKAFESGTSFIRRGGQIMVVDCIEEPVTIIPTLYCYCEWDMKGALCYNDDDYRATINSMGKHIVPFEEMVTKKIKLSDIVKEGFEILTQPDKGGEIKVLVQPED